MTSYLNARPINRRLVVNGTLTLCTATHLGGTDSMSLTDQPILRNHRGIPFIPGTTLAGLFRSHLFDALGGGSEETQDVSQLLGCRWGKDNEEQSPLIVEDARMDGNGVVKTELRDGVKIDATTGTAEKHKKFDVELLPIGTRFWLRFELLLKGQEAEDKPVLENFLWLLQQLESGRISLGGRTRRGFGRCKASGWTYQDINRHPSCSGLHFPRIHSSY